MFLKVDAEVSSTASVPSVRRFGSGSVPVRFRPGTGRFRFGSDPVPVSSGSVRFGSGNFDKLTPLLGR